jgi:hypothetical protein
VHPRPSQRTAAEERADEHQRVVKLVEELRRRHNAELLRLLRQEAMSHAMHVKRVRVAAGSADVARQKHVQLARRQIARVQMEAVIVRHEMELAAMLQRLKIYNVAQLVAASSPPRSHDA